MLGKIGKTVLNILTFGWDKYVAARDAYAEKLLVSYGYRLDEKGIKSFPYNNRQFS